MPERSQNITLQKSISITDYIIEYGSNQRFRVNKDTRIMFKEYYVLFLDETSLPFKIINIGSIDSVHKC